MEHCSGNDFHKSIVLQNTVPDRVLDKVLDRMQENILKILQSLTSITNVITTKAYAKVLRLVFITTTLPPTRSPERKLTNQRIESENHFSVKEKLHSRIGHQSNGILFKRKLLQQVLNFQRLKMFQVSIHAQF